MGYFTLKRPCSIEISSEIQYHQLDSWRWPHFIHIWFKRPQGYAVPFRLDKQSYSTKKPVVNKKHSCCLLLPSRRSSSALPKKGVFSP